MVWIIVCVGVIVAGFIMWDGLHEELPANLRLPKSSSSAHHGSIQTNPANVAQSIGPSQWTVAADARNLRASREFKSTIQAGGQSYYPPVIHLSCYDGAAVGWVEMGLRVTDAESHAGMAAVRINAETDELWQKGDGNVLIIPNVNEFTKVLTNGSLVSLEVSFDEAPRQALHLGTNGVEPIFERLKACR